MSLPTLTDFQRALTNMNIINDFTNSTDDNLADGRLTIEGIQNAGNKAILGSAPHYKGIYAAGVVYEAYNDAYLGEDDRYYRLNKAVTLPYTATQANPTNDTNLSPIVEGLSAAQVDTLIQQFYDANVAPFHDNIYAIEWLGDLTVTSNTKLTLPITSLNTTPVSQDILAEITVSIVTSSTGNSSGNVSLRCEVMGVGMTTPVDSVSGRAVIADRITAQTMPKGRTPSLTAQLVAPSSLSGLRIIGITAIVKPLILL